MIEDNTPEVITGWNSKLYDIPYVCRRLDRVLGEKLNEENVTLGFGDRV